MESNPNLFVLFKTIDILLFFLSGVVAFVFVFSFAFALVVVTDNVRVSLVLTLTLSVFIDFFSSSAISFFDFGPVGGGFSA